LTVLFYLILFLFLGLCALLCFVILIQESKSLGLGASFGGEASTSMFGTSTADVLKKFTGYLALIFLATCVALSLWAAGMSGKTPALPKMAIEEDASP